MEKSKGALVIVGPSLGSLKDSDSIYKKVGEDSDLASHFIFELGMEGEPSLLASSSWTYVHHVPRIHAELKNSHEDLFLSGFLNHSLVARFGQNAGDIYNHYTPFPSVGTETHSVANFRADEASIKYKLAAEDGVAVQFLNGVNEHEMFNQQLHDMQAAVFSGDFDFESDDSNESISTSFREWPSGKKTEPYDL